MNTHRLIDGLRRLDAERPTLPAEHWLKLGAGMVLLMAGGRGSFVARTLSIAAGGVLVYKAFSGRDGLTEMLRRESAQGRRMVRLDGRPVASIDEPEPEPIAGSAEVLRERLSLEEEAASAGGRDAVEEATRT